MTMKALKTIFSALCCSVALTCTAAPINPITQAMLDGYEELLAENPNDYLTLYEMSAQYYRLDDYEKALSIVKRAISCTPAKEKEQLSSEYQLLSDIYTQLKQYPEALQTVEQALVNTPSSYPLLNDKGNICLYMNKTAEAKEAFNAMLRLDSRGSEALFGLARIAAMEGQRDVAQQYLTDAEKMAPGNFLTYCRMGDVHREIGMPQNAAADYLNAFSLSNSSNRPMESLLALAQDNYPAVEEALDYAMSQTTNVVPLYFIMASAASSTSHWEDAYNAYRQLLGMVAAADAESLSAQMAEACLHLGKLDEADNYASHALMQGDKRAGVLKAIIEKSRGNYDTALNFLNSCLNQDSPSTDALMLKAETYYLSGNYDKAFQALNEAVMTDADDARPLLMRGYMQAEKKGDLQAAAGDYKRAAGLPASTTDQLTYKAIAQLKAGLALDAASTISQVKEQADKEASAAYLMALYEQAAGDKEQAAQWLNKAKEAGMDDLYLIDYYSAPLLSACTLR